ncbi:hypothetical protein ACPV5S_15490 [Vibrio astriarenae]
MPVAVEPYSSVEQMFEKMDEARLRKMSKDSIIQLLRKDAWRWESKNREIREANERAEKAAAEIKLCKPFLIGLVNKPIPHFEYESERERYMSNIDLSELLGDLVRAYGRPHIDDDTRKSNHLNAA